MLGAPSTCTDAGPPEKMIPLGSPRQHLGDRRGARHDLGVHVRFAHTAGDQLRVLGAEVDDEDEVVTHEDRLTLTGSR